MGENWNKNNTKKNNNLPPPQKYRLLHRFVANMKMYRYTIDSESFGNFEKMLISAMWAKEFSDKIISTLTHHGSKMKNTHLDIEKSYFKFILDPDGPICHVEIPQGIPH